jgi:hypothetical protein
MITIDPTLIEPTYSEEVNSDPRADVSKNESEAYRAWLSPLAFTIMIGQRSKEAAFVDGPS